MSAGGSLMSCSPTQPSPVRPAPRWRLRALASAGLLLVACKAERSPSSAAPADEGQPGEAVSPLAATELLPAANTTSSPLTTAGRAPSVVQLARAVPRPHAVVPCSVPASLVEGRVLPLPGRFDRFRDDGTVRAVERDRAGKVKRVLTLDGATGAARSSRAMLPGAVAASFDASTQIVKARGRLQRVDADSGQRTALAPALVGDAEGNAALSDDGKLLVTEAGVIDLAASRRVAELGAASAGGPNPTFRIEHEGRLVVAQGRATVLGDLRAAAASGRVTWKPVAGRFDATPDGQTLLDMPYTPFAMDHVSGFVVRDGNTGAARARLALTLPESTPYDGALCHTGTLAVVSLDRTLRLFDAASGQQVLSSPLPASITAPAPPVRFSPEGDAVVVVDGPRLVWLMLQR
jgi:hypothetical protein